MSSTMNLLNQLASQAVVADSLQLALTVGLFDHLQQPRDAQNVAAAFHWQAAKAAHLLELLWSCDLLSREDDRYQTAADAQPFLCQQSDRYLGNAWRFRLASYRQFGAQLADDLSRPPADFSEQPELDSAWAAAAKQQIAEEQRGLTALRAADIAATLPQFLRPATLLDMGGGPGLVSVALAQRYPQMHGVLLDLPLTARVAQQNFVEAGLAGRFTVLSELADDLRFDIIWCSSFLHFVSDPAQTLVDLYQRLKPGGVLIAVHAEIAADAAQALEVLPAYLPLLLRGKHVGRVGEVRAQLLAAGFSRVDSDRQLFPMAPLTVHCAFRAAGE